MKRVYCGIDLGTTNSTLSVIEIERIRDAPMDNLKTLPIFQFDKNKILSKDTNELPSALYFDIDNNAVYTGQFAKAMYSSGDRPMQTVRSVKKRIGGDSRIEVPKYSNPNEVKYFDMTQCSALLLKTIHQTLEKIYDQSVDDAVITVPAAFNVDERQATINAGLLAGFKTMHILDEPTAALLYYINGGEGSVSFDYTPEEGPVKLVYDIGGGTLDVSIASVKEDEEGDIEIDVLARSPRMDLGGDDFDQYLGAYFLSEFERVRRSINERPKEDQNRIISRIVSQAEKFKISMNNKIKARSDTADRIKEYVEFELIDNMSVPEIKLTKGVLDQIFSHYLHMESSPLLKPIKASLYEAKMKKNQISEVLITGGMSNHYVIDQVLRSYFGTGIRMLTIDCVTSVSKGAAIHHYNLTNEELKKLKLKDRMADDIFIKIGDEFKPFITKEKKPGDSGVFNYTVIEDGLPELPVFLYYGSGNSVEHFTALAGTFIPLNNPIEKGSDVKLSWNIDNNKIIQIDVIELDQQLKVRKSSDYSVQQIKSDPIQTLIVNPGGV